MKDTGLIPACVYSDELSKENIVIAGWQLNWFGFPNKIFVVLLLCRSVSEHSVHQSWWPLVNKVVPVCRVTRLNVRVTSRR